MPTFQQKHSRLFGLLVVLLLLVMVLLAGGRPWSVALPSAILVTGLLVVALMVFQQATIWLIWPGIIAFYGLIGSFNPTSHYDSSSDELLPSTSTISWLPSSAEASISFYQSLFLLGLASLLPLSVLLGRSLDTTRRLLTTLACGLMLWAIISVLARFAGVTAFDVFVTSDQWAWRHGVPFGTIDYHGNAGTLVLIGGVLACFCFRGTGSKISKSIWFLSATGLVCTGILAINTSRAALAIAVFLIPICVLVSLRMSRHATTRCVANSKAAGLIAVLLLALTVLGGGTVTHSVAAQTSVERFIELKDQVSREHYPRRMEYELAWDFFVQRPLYGYGPGTYPLIADESSIEGYHFVPHFEPGMSPKAQHHLKQDLLQILVEWGLIGTALLMLPVVSAGCVVLFRSKRMPVEARRLQLAIVACVSVVALHGLVDCPLQLPAIQAIVLVMLGLLIASPSWVHEGSET